MKLLRNTAKKVSALILGVAAIYSTNAEMPKDEPLIKSYKSKIGFDNTIIPFKVKKNNTQALNFVTFDSVANTLSYGVSQQVPLYYDKNFDMLLTIRRGSHDNLDQGFDESNSKNNLFITSSQDYITWTKPALVYSAQNEGNGDARYPSLFSYKNEQNNQTVLFCFNSLVPRPNTAGLFDWKGYGIGIKDQNSTATVTLRKFTKNSIDYDFGTMTVDATTQEKSWFSMNPVMTGFSKDNVINQIVIAPISPTPSGSKEDNGNIAVCKLNDLELGEINIPPAFASSKFISVKSGEILSRDISKMAEGPDGEKCLVITGQFRSQANDSTKILCGVSISKDNGLTWSEIDVFPHTYIKDVVANNFSTIDPDSVGLSFNGSKDVISWGNGNWSIFAAVYNTAENIKFPDRKVFIVELYKKNGEFGANLVAQDLPPGTAFLIDRDPNDQERKIVSAVNDYEIQAAPSVDYSSAIVKWVEVLGIAFPTDTTYSYNSSDAFFSFKKATDTKWSNKVNLTKDDMLDKATWIPQMYKDSKTIPFMRLETVNNAADINQRVYVWRQYCRMATFDAEALITSDVNESNEQTTNYFSLIYPNPSSNSANIELNLNNTVNVKLELSDIQGNILIAKNLNNVNFGLNNINLDLTTLNSGKYFVTVNVNGKRETKSLTVVK